MPMQYLEQLKQIRNAGFRVTPQRQLILDVLHECGGHATAREVYERVAVKVPTINRATVYRVLDFFCERQLATKTEINGRTMYEMMGEEPHHHLVCLHCERVTVLTNSHFDELLHHLEVEHGFRAELHHLAIPGVCAHCRQNGRSHHAS